MKAGPDAVTSTPAGPSISPGRLTVSVILPDTNPIPVQRTTAHPSWCDPRSCTTTPDTADELLVVHRRVVLDEQLDGLPRDGRVVVDLVRGDIVCAHGGELLAADRAAVRVRGVGDETEISPAQAARIAAAVAHAAELAGGAR